MARKIKGDTYYGKIAAQYIAVREKHSWWHVEQDEMKTLLEKLPRNLKVVDIPFGTGRFVPYYLEFGYEVHGLDASDEMIRAAKKYLGDDFNKCRAITGTSTDLPFNDGEFDLLVSTRFIREIITFKDAKKTFKEFARVTNKYAIIQLGVNPSGKSIPPGEGDSMGSRFSMKDVEALLKEYGFKVTDKRQVKGSKEEGSEIYHFLLEKA